MRFTFAFLLAGLCAFAVAEHHKKYHVADKDYLQKEKQILTLFKYIHQPTYYKEHMEIAKNWHFEQHKSDFTKPEYYEQFYKYWQYGMLKRGEIFSIFHHEHKEQAEVLFKMFYYAKDFETFYKFAVWARQYVNEGMFLYSFSVALVHRPDTYKFILPPIYEIYPHYFFSTEVINEAYHYKMKWDGHTLPEHDGYHGYTIWSNYSGHYLNLHPEQSMAYFMEDIGINSFYYYYNIYYPYWMDGEEFHIKHDHRGELFYFVHQQILARFYMERLSNGWGDIEWFNWDKPFETGYYPSLEYHNGLEFPSRPNFAKLHEYFYNYGQKWSFKSEYGYGYTAVTEYEKRILDAIDFGYVFDHQGKKYDLYTPEGFNMLGNLIEGNHDSVHYKYYGQFMHFARHLLGYSWQPYDYHHVAPSALEHFETSLRDPAFYQLFKKVILYFQQYKMHLPKYTDKQLWFPGVKVSNVEFSELVTFFDVFYSDITNAVYVTPEEYQKDSFQVRVAQERLNYKPFTYKIHVDSDKATKAAVKVFYGPKYDEYDRYMDINENRMNFVQFDHFVYDLKSGSNVIERNSYDSDFFYHDDYSYEHLYHKVKAAFDGKEEFHLYGNETYFNFPFRFALPKGTYDGFDFQFYVIVYPYTEYQHHSSEKTDEYFTKPGTGDYVDGYAFGFPFDRHVDPYFFYNTPNHYFYNATVYHYDYYEDFEKYPPKHHPHHHHYNEKFYNYENHHQHH